MGFGLCYKNGRKPLRSMAWTGDLTSFICLFFQMEEIPGGSSVENPSWTQWFGGDERWHEDRFCFEGIASRAVWWAVALADCSKVFKISTFSLWQADSSVVTGKTESSHPPFCPQLLSLGSGGANRSRNKTNAFFFKLLHSREAAGRAPAVSV